MNVRMRDLLDRLELEEAAEQPRAAIEILPPLREGDALRAELERALILVRPLRAAVFRATATAEAA